MAGTDRTPARVGPYRVERELGRGGMGIVYLAHDTRLDRAVALKSLPADLAADPERLERFEREAKVLASLNHPNIAAIYDIAEADGQRFLALEHVEGVTLAQRLAAGALPRDETIGVCLQIASGMEAAHERGVVHRDLKPGNVMITPGDQVKIVDFGLARGRVAEAPGSAGPSASLPDASTLTSPTVASPAAYPPGTIPGVILGTAPYLSPEQARGKPVDRRTDIWALGCILFECLSGGRAFPGETVSDTIAKILERDPDWTLIPRGTPPGISDLLRRCLEKDPMRRLRDMGDARIVLEDARTGSFLKDGDPSAPPRPAARFGDLRLGIPIALAVLGLTAFAIGPWSPLASLRTDRAALRGPLNLSLEVPPDRNPIKAELTRDGKALIVQSTPRVLDSTDPRPSRIHIRRLNARSFENIPGTEGTEDFQQSQDGRWLYCLTTVSLRPQKRRIFRVPLDGNAPPTPFCDWDQAWNSWDVLGTGEVLAFVGRANKCVKIDGAAAVPESISFSIPNPGASCSIARVLPHDRGVLLRVESYTKGVFHRGIGVLDLRAGTSKMLVQDGGSAWYAPTGLLLFTRGATLLAMPFDLGRLEPRGNPIAVLGGLRSGLPGSNAEVGVSPGGTLVYIRGEALGERRVVVVDPSGIARDWSNDRKAFYAWLSVSPDGSRFAALMSNSDLLDEIWISERGAPNSRKIVSMAGADCSDPIWSPDGRNLVFVRIARDKSDGLYTAPMDGSGTPKLIFSSDSVRPLQWLSGSRILCSSNGSGKPALAVLVPSASRDHAYDLKPLPLQGSQYFGGCFSPDGHWLAYSSDEAGLPQVFVRQVRADGGLGEPHLVSVKDGGPLAWSPDGRKLYYLTFDNRVIVASWTAEPRPGVRSRITVWNLDSLGVAFSGASILPDGSLVATLKAPGEGEITDFDLTLNFFDELRAKMRKARK